MRWALVGASDIASQFLIRAIRSREGVIGRVVSSSAERGREYSERHGIPEHGTDIEEAMGDSRIDAVYISSTNERHFPQAMAAIEAGKHVLCEKPLAVSLADAATMVRAAEAAGVTFATNHHLRSSGSHGTIRKLIEEGRVGDVLSLRIHHALHLPQHLLGWRIQAPETCGGAVMDLAVHDVDIIRFLVGEDPRTVVAETGASGPGQTVEDSAMSVLTMPSGAMATTHESFTHPCASAGLQVHGTRGSIVARGVLAQRPLGKIMLLTEDGAETVPFPDHDPYGRVVAAFADAASGQGRPDADGWDGVKSLAVALAMLESARTGTRQTIRYEA